MMGIRFSDTSYDIELDNFPELGKIGERERERERERMRERENEREREREREKVSTHLKLISPFVFLVIFKRMLSFHFKRKTKINI